MAKEASVPNNNVWSVPKRACSWIHWQTGENASVRGKGQRFPGDAVRAINSIDATIQQLIQESIEKDITKAGMFSVQTDTTHDFTSQDQCCVVLRYCMSKTQLTRGLCRESTGQYFVDMLSEVAETLKLDLKKCHGHATGGASNMQGHCKGFSTLMSKESQNQVPEVVPVCLTLSLLTQHSWWKRITITTHTKHECVRARTKDTDASL